MSEPLKVLTADELAAKLQVHPKTVYANRDIPRIELGDGTIRFIESQVDQWLLTKQTRKAAPRKRIIRRNSNVVDMGGLTRKDMDHTG